MSKNGCYNCGSFTHKFFQCPEPGSKLLEKTIKQNIREANLPSTERSMAIWQRKRQIKQDEPLPARFLKSEMIRYLSIFQNWNEKLEDIGKPCICRDQIECPKQAHDHLKIQLLDLNQLDSERKTKWPEIRTLIASSKAYFLKWKPWLNDEDYILSTYLDDLETCRIPFHNALGQTLVNAKDAERYTRQIVDSVAEQTESVTRLEQNLRTGRPVSNEDLDNNLDILCEIGHKVMELEKYLHYIQDKCVVGSSDWILGTILELQNHILNVKGLAKQKRAAIFEEASDEGICIICFDRRNEVVFICGHQMCGQCGLEVQNFPPDRRSCPKCRGPVDQMIFLMP